MKKSAISRYSENLHTKFDQGRYDEISNDLIRQRDNSARYAANNNQETGSAPITRKRSSPSTVQENAIGETLLHRFVKLEHPFAMRYFAQILHLGEANDINKRAYLGLKPIHYAIQFGNQSRITTLVSMGADVKGLKGGIEGLVRFARANNAKAEVINYLESEDFRGLVNTYKDKASQIVRHATEAKEAKLHRMGQSSITKFLNKYPTFPVVELDEGLLRQNSVGSLVEKMDGAELEEKSGSSSALALRRPLGSSGFDLRRNSSSSNSTEAVRGDNRFGASSSSRADLERILRLSNSSKGPAEMIDLTFDDFEYDIPTPPRIIRNQVLKIRSNSSASSESTSVDRSDSEHSRESSSVNSTLPRGFQTAKEMFLEQGGTYPFRNEARSAVASQERELGAKNLRRDSISSIDLTTSSDSEISSDGLEAISVKRDRNLSPLRVTKKIDNKPTPPKISKSHGRENEDPNSPSSSHSTVKYDEDISLADRGGWVSRVATSGSSQHTRY